MLADRETAGSAEGFDMDYATKLAIRAVVSGLHHAGTIDQRHISAIVQALTDAAATARDRGKDVDADKIDVLRQDIARDGQVSG